jgi:PadR family transcriptional regulator, regulatory protein PadR
MGTQVLKGVLDLAVLAVLAEGDGYGYELVRREPPGRNFHVPR